MDTARKAHKATVKLPCELHEKTAKASGAGVAQTATGLQFVGASRAYDLLRQLRGEVRFPQSVAELKADR